MGNMFMGVSTTTYHIWETIALEMASRWSAEHKLNSVTV